MKKINFVEQALQIFVDHCRVKGYQLTKFEESGKVRINVFYSSHKVTISIFNNGSIQIQGFESLLKTEMLCLKEEITKVAVQKSENNKKLAARTETLYVILPVLRDKIRETLSNFGDVSKINDDRDFVEYSYKVECSNSSITLTQYVNGTLVIQGKNDLFFEDFFGNIQRTIGTSEKDQIEKYIYFNSGSNDFFDTKDPNILFSKAEDNIRCELSDEVYEYLYSRDKDLLIAFECMCLSRVQMPEYSTTVMPVSKALEGFVKKVMTDIGLVDKEYFKSKKAPISGPLIDKNSANWKLITSKYKYAESYLKLIDSTLDIYRNFMMHSDDHEVTKVASLKDAKNKASRIFLNMKDIFKYFFKVEGIIPKKDSTHFEPNVKLFETYQGLKATLEFMGVNVSDYKLIDYGLQFSVSVSEWSKKIRLYQNAMGIIKIDCSQLGNDSNAKKIRNFLKEKDVSDNSEIDEEEINLKTPILPLIGTDESGKGDFFGPLVCAAVYVDKESAEKLVSCGVKDCKKLSDQQNIEIAGKIYQICRNHLKVIELPPERYNLLYEQLESENKNLNTLLAWGHAKAIEELLNVVECNNAIIDQFANEKYLESKLQDKGKKLDLIQMHKAEKNIAVAAASIIARTTFLERMNRLSKRYKIDFPKGASDAVIDSAKKFISIHGEEELRKVAKLHFKTINKVFISEEAFADGEY